MASSSLSFILTHLSQHVLTHLSNKHRLRTVAALQMEQWATCCLNTGHVRSVVLAKQLTIIQTQDVRVILKVQVVLLYL